MLERIENLPAGVVGVRARGKVTKDDYDDVLWPVVRRAAAEERKLNFLYEFTPEFEGFTSGAALEDGWIGLRHARQFRRCALVADVPWIRSVSRASGALLPFQLKAYRSEERAEALTWLAQPVTADHLGHRVLPEANVLVLEPRGRLGPEDFESLAITVNAFVEQNGELRGVVIHAREFPGWQGFWGLLEHARFVRQHHRGVRRIAVASDATFARLTSKVGARFAHAEVARFDYDQSDAAIAWASGHGGAESPAAASSNSAVPVPDDSTV